MALTGNSAYTAQERDTCSMVECAWHECGIASLEIPLWGTVEEEFRYIIVGVAGGAMQKAGSRSMTSQ